MYTLRVTRYGRTAGRVCYDPKEDRFDPDPGIPASVVSDILVTYYRDNVLIGESGDGYCWAEVAESQVIV